MITGPWTSKQFGLVVDQFRAECPAEAWDDVLIRYAVLRTRGPFCGTQVAKKLKNSKNIWELLGHADNIQPRLLFYFSPSVPQLIVFVHAFIKQGRQDYLHAIRLAQKRRAMIERGERPLNVIDTFKSARIH